LINYDDGIHPKKESQRQNILLHSRRNIRRNKKNTKTKSHKISRKYRKHPTKIQILGRKPLNWMNIRARPLYGEYL
ncbi:MAG: hypothetical protein V1729_04430, partial [Candidatus Woesearchaeota archaeon]